MYDRVMVWIIGGAIKGAIIKLACPHCSEMQLRARAHHGGRYRCRRCNKLFTKEEGEKQAKRRSL